MSSKKEKEFKEFIISVRKKIKPGLTIAPVWVMQKAGKRMWNKKQKRHWKEADIGKLFKKKQRKIKVKKFKKPGKVHKKLKK